MQLKILNHIVFTSVCLHDLFLCNKLPQTWWMKTTNICYLSFWGSGIHAAWQGGSALYFVTRMQSSHGFTRAGSASKLTHEVVGQPYSLLHWALAQSCLTTWQLISPRQSSPNKIKRVPEKEVMVFV